MKRICLVFLLLLSHVYCQDYINVQLNSGYKYGLLDDISKITFNTESAVINFEINNGYVDSEYLDDIIKITFDAEKIGDVSLPVELQNFWAVQSDDNVRLYWETASEVNNYGFEIERLHDDISEWEKIGFLEGNGSCSTANSYSFSDKKASKFSNLKYRLKQIDYDGTYEYSPEISVTLGKIMLPDEFTLHKNYPNPFNPTTTISYEIVEQSFTTMIIYDMQGKEIEVLVNKNQTPGKYKIKFNGDNLASGVYFCKLTSGNNTQLIKMLLVK